MYVNIILRCSHASISTRERSGLSAGRFANDLGRKARLFITQNFQAYLTEARQDNLWPLLPKILEIFPELNRDWLYFGEGAMFTRNNVPEGPTSPHDCQRRITELEAELKEERALNRRLTERLLEMGKN